jgi:hypothetical protein
LLKAATQLWLQLLLLPLRCRLLLGRLGCLLLLLLGQLVDLLLVRLSLGPIGLLLLLCLVTSVLWLLANQGGLKCS